MSDPRYHTLSELIDDLSEQMQAGGLWANEPPSAKALQSDQPFCVDTLQFEQWVQFVMIPAFSHMIRQQLPLPLACDITPMAEEIWKQQHQNVQTSIKRIDALISRAY